MAAVDDRVVSWQPQAFPDTLFVLLSLKMLISKIVPTVCLLWMFTLNCMAQKAPEGFRTDAFRTGGNEYQVWSGYSPDSAIGIGKSQSRRFFLAGFGWRRVILANDSVAWKFTVDAVPVALISEPTLNGITVVPDPKKISCAGCAIGRRTSYAYGIEPVGFEFNFRRQRRYQPIAGINGGVLKFNYDVPVPNSNSFNFTFSVKAGLQVFTRQSRSLTIGYRYQHTSNANTGNPFNPGIDSNFVYAGFSFHR